MKKDYANLKPEEIDSLQDEVRARHAMNVAAHKEYMKNLAKQRECLAKQRECAELQLKNTVELIAWLKKFAKGEE